MKGFNRTLFIIASVAVLSSAGLVTISYQATSGEMQIASPRATATPALTPTTTPNQPVAPVIEAVQKPAEPPPNQVAEINTSEPGTTPGRETLTPVVPAPTPTITTVTEKPSIPIIKAPATPTSLVNLVNQLTNDARAKRGLPSLSYNVELAEVAKERSQDMITNNYFSHTSPDGCDVTCRFEQTSLHTLTWGENIATYEGLSLSSTEEAVKTLFNDWLQSRGHRENILSETFTHQGVGIAIQNDQLIITVVFASPK